MSAADRSNLRPCRAPSFPECSGGPALILDPERCQSLPDGGEVPGVALDRAGRLFVLARQAPHLYVLSGANGGQSLWPTPPVMRAHHLILDSQDRPWIVDQGAHAVFRLDRHGAKELVLGTPGQPGCDDRHFREPAAIAVASDGHLFVADGYGNRRIVHFDPDGLFINDWGSEGEGPGQFRLPHGIAADGKDHVFVADREGARISAFDRQGTLLFSIDGVMIPWAIQADGQDRLWAAGSLPQRDSKTGRWRVAPQDAPTIMVFETNSRRVLSQWRLSPASRTGPYPPGQCRWLHSLALAKEGRIFLGEVQGWRVHALKVQG